MGLNMQDILEGMFPSPNGNLQRAEGLNALPQWIWTQMDQATYAELAELLPYTQPDGLGLLPPKAIFGPVAEVEEVDLGVMSLDNVENRLLNGRYSNAHLLLLMPLAKHVRN
ncbi:hypothetical protein HDE_05696 [Halotydeus destructor]|nr:hypothetical protein HDE_05696 [Halotydeus destructor]